MTDVRDGRLGEGIFAPQAPIREQLQKGPSAIGLRPGGSKGSYILKENCR